MDCPCGREKAYKSCCGKVHKNINKAKTAEDLMRSRYTAFTMANGDYLMKSHHSSTRPLSEKQSIESWAKSVEWLRLQVLQSGEDHVEFKAYYMENGQESVIHEHSKFVKENGHWTYLGLF